MKKLILSSVGTSLLTNKNKNLPISKYSNCITAGEIPADVFNEIKVNAEELKNESKNLGTNLLRKCSAELNGILGILENDWNKGKQYEYFLITTDTYLGKLCGEILKEILEYRLKNCVQIYSPNRQILKIRIMRILIIFASILTLG